MASLTLIIAMEGTGFRDACSLDDSFVSFKGKRLLALQIIVLLITCAIIPKRKAVCAVSLYVDDGNYVIQFEKLSS